MQDQRAGARHKLLAVDDEPANLELLTRVFRGGFEVLAASSGAEAIELLAAHRDVAVIVCDQRMPGLSGSDVLEQAHRMAPHATRVLLTAYSDHEAVVDAINRGKVWYYLSKPVPPETLRSVVSAALQIYLLTTRNRELSARLVENNQELIARVEELEHSLDERTRELLETRRRADELAARMDLPAGPSQHPSVRLRLRRVRAELNVGCRVAVLGEPYQEPVPHTRGWERIAIPASRVGEVFEGRIVDLTESGARIACATVLPLLSRVGLTFQLEGFGTAYVLALVVSRRTEPTELPRQSLPPLRLESGFGVLFEYTPLDVRHAVAELVQRQGV